MHFKVAMVAAMHNHKEALQTLLAPFFSTPLDSDIDLLLHHVNKKGQNLMAFVSVHCETLFAAHGMLVEFEAAVHSWNSYQVMSCFRKHLGTVE